MVLFNSACSTKNTRNIVVCSISRSDLDVSFCSVGRWGGAYTDVRAFGGKRSDPIVVLL